MTSRQLVYMILDEIKAVSDDATFNEEHVLFLLSKYRAFLIQKEYERNKNNIPESSYQEICLDLNLVPAIEGLPCEGGFYLKSTVKIPKLLGIGNTSVYPEDFYQGNITYVSRNRMKHVGSGKFSKNFIYASLGPDNYLYLKSTNPQYKYIEKVRMSGIFEDYDEAAKLSCDTDDEGNAICDILDKEFKIEEYLVPQLIELIVKELLGAEYRIKDGLNNASDSIPNIAAAVASRNNQQQ